VARPSLLLSATVANYAIEESEQMYTALRKRDIDATFIRCPDMAHGGSTPWNMVHRYHHQLQWWQQYLAQNKAATE